MRNVDCPTLNTLSLCSGVGMLDQGLHAGLEFLGIRSRAILFAEREDYPVAVLAARMEEGSIPAAPIWFGDFTELPASQFYGMVDCVAAGFPCQDLSVAGKRVGLDGKRSGLFFEVVRIATDCGARFMLLENVSGIASATASVVDATEGELDERAAARVVGELADLGWNSEWITISASDVGASHGRARWFCWAWRGMADASGRLEIRGAAGPNGRKEPGCEGPYVADTESIRGRKWKRDEFAWGAEVEGASEQLADPARNERDGLNRESWSGRRVCQAGDELGDAKCTRWPQARCGYEIDSRCESQSGCGSVADADRTGLGAIRERQGRAPNALLCHQELFAPGPADPEWAGILERYPELAPALEPAFCGVVNGLAFNMGDNRAQRLKCVGNGVVPAQCAVAVVELVRRAGIFTGKGAHQ